MDRRRGHPWSQHTLRPAGRCRRGLATENLAGLATAVSTAPAWNWPLLARAAWERGPELLAMLIGQGLLLLILFLARGTLLAENPDH